MIKKNVWKRKCAAYLALLLMLLPVSEVSAEPVDKESTEGEAVSIQVTTGTQEAAKEREENKKENAEQEDEDADET